MKKIILLLIPTLFILLHFIVIKINQWQIPHKFIQKKVMIKGIIDSVPKHKFQGFQFLFHVQSIQHQKINTHFLITWYRNSPKLKVGEQWKFTVKLKPPIGLYNPGEFNYAQYLKRQGITATGYVVTYKANNKLLGVKNTYFLEAFRQKIENHIFRIIHNRPCAAFASALSVGLRDALVQSDWQVFQKTGTNHLIAIAGLHIGFVFASIYFLSKYIWRLFPSLLLRIPATRAAEMIGLIGALGYTLLSGLEIPAQRAFIMLCCFVGAQWFHRKISITRRLIFSATIILILNPYDLVDASFWLSFSSIAMLSWTMHGRLQAISHLKSWGKMQWSIVVGLLPLMLFYFQQASLIALLTNAIAIPWVGFLILPLCIFATGLYFLHAIALSNHLFWLVGKLLLPLWHFLSCFSHWSYASWHHAITHVWILIAGMMGVVFLLAPRGLSLRYLGCFGLLPLFFYHAACPAKNYFTVTVLDVGQGVAVLVQTAKHSLLYETKNKNKKLSDEIVAAYLKERNIHKLSAIFDTFHAVPNLTNKLTNHWNWDGVHFEILSDSVMKIFDATDSILLTSNIQKTEERNLVDNDRKQLASTVLLIPDFGSKKAYEKSFVNTVSPTIAIISAAKYNRYHWPSKSVLSHYFMRGVNVYNTANNGAITIRFLPKGQVRLNTIKKR